jgi:hypothetical protein
MRLATAPIAAAALILGYGVAVLSGSRALGGVVLVCVWAVCAAIWLRRDGGGAAARLTGIGLIAFALSHIFGLLIGAWPAVVVSAAAVAYASWRVSDSRRTRSAARARAAARPSP